MTFKDDIAHDMAETIFSTADLAGSITYKGETIPAHVDYEGKPGSRYAARVARLIINAADVDLPKDGDAVTIDGHAWTVRIDSEAFTMTGNGFSWTVYATADERRISR